MPGAVQRHDDRSSLRSSVSPSMVVRMAADAPTVFLLSPARLDGARGRSLLSPDSGGALSQRLRSAEGISLEEAFSFVSSLYFRGKAAYARHFCRAPHGRIRVVTAGGGLVKLEERVTLARLQGWGRVAVREDNPHFTAPLLRHTAELLDEVPSEARFLLLGSVASNKYVQPLLELLGSRLLYPVAFEGRGDMSRGALLLAALREDRELEYAAVASRGASLREGNS